MSLGCWDRCRCYRHCGTKSRSTGWRDSEGTGDCPLGRASALGDEGFRFRRPGFPRPRHRKMDEKFPMFPISENDCGHFFPPDCSY